MKAKNAIMASSKLRFTVIMVALALVTSVFAVGTLSKYTIGGAANDTAAVAKWGVTIDIEGENSFAEQSSNGAIISASTNRRNVVAPGTDTVESDGLMKVTLKGTPEVAFRLTIDLGEVGTTNQDVFLAAGTYPNYTKATGGTDPRDTFTIAENYYPVEFTFTHYYTDESWSLAGCVGNSGVAHAEDANYVDANGHYDAKETFTGTLAELDAFFANISQTMEYVNANYVLDDQFTLEWRWVFDEEDGGNSLADTMLGNLAADATTFGTFTIDEDEVELVDGTDYNLDVAYNFTITIEQLDE